MSSIIQKIKNIYHLFRALLANIIYGFPSRKLKVIGVTGTDGKTTTTHLIYHILKTAGHKVSMISTIYAKIGDREFDTGFHVTTPDAFLIPKYLKMAVDAKQEYFVLETTSHRLDQNQLWGTRFDISVLTNVSHEHLDYHKTYENYIKAKVKLLTSSKKSIINCDDKSFSIISKILKSHEKDFYSYGFKHKSDFNFPYLKKVTGFNRYNFLAGFAVATLLNIPENVIEKAVKSFKLPPGRLEVVYKKDFTVMIDFAHTPNAFAELLPLIQKVYLKNKGHIIHVFGAASQRDSSKRPIMGEKSSQFSDYIILTEEDCRKEDPKKIAEEIAKGIHDKKIYEIILDRQSAINRAISMAKKDDVVVLTGKSHEKSLCRGKKEYPWSEHEAVARALALKNNDL
jgi:UDP-N-acetylmuramoyl-L-alanyl-D-glutamate--2,6-diaminopimelate ligase